MKFFSCTLILLILVLANHAVAKGDCMTNEDHFIDMIQEQVALCANAFARIDSPVWYYEGFFGTIENLDGSPSLKAWASLKNKKHKINVYSTAECDPATRKALLTSIHVEYGTQNLIIWDIIKNPVVDCGFD